MPGSRAVEVELTQIRIRSTGECAHPLPAFRESGAGKVKRWGLGLRLDGGEWTPGRRTRWAAVHFLLRGVGQEAQE